MYKGGLKHASKCTSLKVLHLHGISLSIRVIMSVLLKMYSIPFISSSIFYFSMNMSTGQTFGKHYRNILECAEVLYIPAGINIGITSEYS